MINMAARVALRSYPPSFRERYGCELEALVEDTGAGPSVVADLLVGSLRAWLRPVMPDESAEGRRRRMQASVATTWVTWCAALYALPMLDFILSEEPGLTPDLVRRLLDVAQYAMYGAGLIVLTGGLAVLAETSRTGNRAALRPLVALIPTLPTWLIAPFLLVYASIDPISYWVGALAVLGPAAFLITMAVAPAVVVTRCRPSAKVLRLLALSGVAVAFAVTTTGIACVAALTMNTDDAAQLITMPILAVTVAASAAALVSSGRGAKAALHRERPVDLGGDV
ncbi:hypothetical protein BFF78_35895 [Streptomyces fodineus]|uniref:Uncharacterized protein n=1 Tax=Streptomyces fodineus TaxID=1904616 RepID=A0A1D7YJM3_9ACTN|nr:hypothetical protein [Streptomyces fodineus]AOR35744.1 hypothetical protein BFF78_35895 [Streptomyces fodineus]